MRKRYILMSVVVASLLLSSCAADPRNGPAAASSAPTVSEGATSPGADADHGTDEHYGAPDMVWDAEAETTVQRVAGKVMGLYARPDLPAGMWFSDLAPYLSPEYAEDAKYIDPARVPVRKVTDGPALSREAGNPSTVTASFSTDAGRWQIVLHRSGQHEPWLVTSIAPQDPA